jgi:methylmalonyl-CoA/ethylmalonyl-CoA epimerase
MLKGIDHVGVLVDDLEEAMAFLESLGFTLYKLAEAPARQRRAAFFDCGTGGGIELIQDLDADVSLRNLGQDKAKVEHIAIEVDDLTQTLAALAKLGINPDDHGIVRGPFKARDRETAWTEPGASTGLMYQFVAYSERTKDPA